MLRVNRVKAEGPGIEFNVARQKNKQKKKNTAEAKVV